jgi:hypothetical protein
MILDRYGEKKNKLGVLKSSMSSKYNEKKSTSDL